MPAPAPPPPPWLAVEVGRIAIDGKMHLGWNRAHFGAWCVVSAPLILGMDLTHTPSVAAVIDVITNEEAIAVNQEWAGHPGRLVWSDLRGVYGYPAARACNPSNPALKQTGWALRPLAAKTRSVPAGSVPEGKVSLVAPGGGCLKVQGRGAPGGAGGLVVAACNATDDAQAFAYNASTMQLSQGGRCVDVHSGGPIVWIYGCSASPNDQLRFDETEGTVRVEAGGGRCFGLESDDPAGATFESTLQAWAKPLKQGVALLLINPDTSPHDVSLPMYTLPLLGSGANVTASPKLDVRDIWAHASLTPVDTAAGVLKLTVPPLDSVFLRLEPTSAAP